jgi:hypothetical protein
LTYTENCDGQIPAYWAGTLPVMSLPIEPFEGLDQRTVGTVLVNGVKLRAMFNSTNSMSAISLKALKKLGVSPDGGGAEKDGDNSPGRQVKLDNIDIGGETLRGGTLRVSDFGKIDVDMVIGLDFFLAHRIYVGNGLRRMYFTYSKGPVFGVLPAQPNPVEGPAISSAK